MERIARWESRQGKTWIELYKDSYGYSYKGESCGGYMGKMENDEAAIADLEKRRAYLTPDSHKNLIKRVI